MTQIVANRIDGPAGYAIPINRRNAPYPEASVAFWLLHIPGPSPAWDHYALSIVGLQDYFGIPEAVKNYPEAEYEIMFCAVDSKHNPRADITESIRFLQPINYLEQFHGVSSEAATEVAHSMVRAFVDGSLFPEPQGIVGAKKLFRQTLELALKIGKLITDCRT